MRPLSRTMPRGLPFLDTQPLTEHDILLFHACFLSVGLHSIETSDMRKARSIISTLLTSLDYYRAIAWVTQEAVTIPGFFNLYDDIVLHGHKAALEDYIVESFNYDCLWIEDMHSWPWLGNLKKTIYSIGLDKQIPIIVVSEVK